MEDFFAGVGFAGDDDGFFIADDFGGEGGLGPIEFGGEHLTSLVVVAVGRLFAHEDEVGPEFAGEGGQFGGHDVGVEGVVGFDEDGAVGPDGESFAELVFAFGRADGDDSDIDLVVCLFHTDCLFDGDFIEWVDIEFDPGQVEPGPVGEGTDFCVRIDDAFDGDEDFHGLQLRSGLPDSSMCFIRA